MAKGWLGRWGNQVVAALERQGWLDRFSGPLEFALASVFRSTGQAGQHLKDFLHGTWFGEPLHPPLTDVPIGAWTTAVVLDVLEERSGRRRGYGRAADDAVVLGILGAGAAAVTGLNDWQHLHYKDQRVGMAHGLLNTAALLLFGTSLVYRRRGLRARGRWVARLGYGVLLSASYLGGNLVFHRRIGVNHTEDPPEPREFTPVLAEALLREGEPRRVEVRDIRIVLVRHRGRIHALGATCAHMGGPLAEGWLSGEGLVCPWHGSRYALEDGQVLEGPSTTPLPCFETRVRQGYIEVRRSQPGRMSEGLPVRRPGPPAPRWGREATELLTGYHRLIQGLFQQLEEAPATELSRRKQLLERLADELLLHEEIEEQLFYPEVRRASALEPQARAQHRVMGDLLAVVEHEGPSSARFQERLEELRRSVEHHMREEEEQMFPEAHRLGGEELRRIGARLEQRYKRMKASALSRTRRAAIRASWRLHLPALGWSRSSHP